MRYGKTLLDSVLVVEQENMVKKDGANVVGLTTYFGRWIKNGATMSYFYKETGHE